MVWSIRALDWLCGEREVYLSIWDLVVEWILPFRDEIVSSRCDSVSIGLLENYSLLP